MAGNAKPSVVGIGPESQYTVLSVVGSQGSGGTISNCGLFDGTQVNEWNTAHVMYWADSSNYLEININSNVNIWRSGTTSWINSKGTLKILSWNGTSYVDVTSNYTQTVNAITETQWEKSISNLPAGRYKFVGVSARIDSEWYFEALPAKYLINSLATNKLYTISTGTIVETTANTDVDKYNAGFTLSTLNNAVLNSTTLKTISPFKLLSFNTYNDNYTKITGNGIKSSSELFISNQNLLTKPAIVISKIFLDKTLINSGNVKVVISSDNMGTWKTWNGTSWVLLTNTIVDKPYSTMSSSEQTQWDVFKNEIINVGMTDTILQTANLSGFLGQNLRFAFTIIRPTYSDTATLKDLQWTYTGKDKWVLLNNSDIKTSINEDFIQLTSTRNITKVKANIIT